MVINSTAPIIPVEDASISYSRIATGARCAAPSITPVAVTVQRVAVNADTLVVFLAKVLVCLTLSANTCFWVTLLAPFRHILTIAALFLVWVIPLVLGAAIAHHILVLIRSLSWGRSQILISLLKLITYLYALGAVWNKLGTRQTLSLK